MKKNLFTSFAVALGVSAVRLIDALRHPEWSSPIWLPVAVAFVGSFIGSFAVLTGLRLIQSIFKRKEPS